MHISSFCRFASAVVAAAVINVASAEVLVYEGFHSSDYTDEAGVKSTAPVGTNTGFSAEWGWSDNTAIPKTVAGSLTIGAAYDIAETNGTYRLQMKNGGNQSKGRGVCRRIVPDLSTTNVFYFRFIMKVDTTPANAVSTLQTGCYWAGGLVPTAIKGGGDAIKALTDDGIWMGYKKTSSTDISLVGRVAGMDYILPYSTTAGTITEYTTYIFIARVEVGAGTGGKDVVSLFASPIATGKYSASWEWCHEGIEADVVGDNMGYIAFAGQYYTGDYPICIDQYKIATTLNEVCNHILTPKLKDALLAHDTSDDTYDISAVLTNCAATVSYVLDDGSTSTTNSIGSYSIGDTVLASFNAPADNKTYEVVVVAKDTQTGGESSVSLGYIYGGALSLTKVSDGAETGLAPATLTVSRASADTKPLVVNYAFKDGTAVAGRSYVDDDGSVIIPAGETSATISVTPLMDNDSAVDTSMTVSVVDGNYTAPASGIEVTIANFTTPAGYNYWIGGTANDNGECLASTPANWSSGSVPTATDTVVFNGDYSTCDCTWDADAPQTVGAWSQTSTYTGTVMFNTEFSDYSGASFTQFTINGDCTIGGGSWSCRGNYNNFGVSATTMSTYMTDKHYCLNVSVGGAMTIAEGASVTVTGRGYGYPTSDYNKSMSYGGYAYEGSTEPYGSITEPFEPGKGCLSQGDGNNRNKVSGIGGGAVKLTVAGNLAVDGSIVALGTIDKNVARSGGTGGSIWIVANQVSGFGAIDASACPKSYFTTDLGVSIGSGGRIAIYTKSALEFSVDNISCSGTSYAGTSQTSKTKVSGPGTIYVKDPSQAHGTLYVKQSTSVATSGNIYTGTPVMGDLSLDAVVLSGYAQLRVVEGSSLTLPSLSAVTTLNSSAGVAGLVYAGGTLNIGSGDQTLKANVAFASPAAFTFPGSLTLEEGAKLGSVNGAFGQSGSVFDKVFTVTVTDDLTIPSGATAGATRCCAYTASGTTQYAAHGGQSLWCDNYGGYGKTNGFDSVLNPSMPGGSNYRGFKAGGVFDLTVGGTLTLNGSLFADGGNIRGVTDKTDQQGAAAGGTVDINAGALAGTTGLISANGGCGTYNYAGGAGGGRVAVRLTGSGATFSDYWKTNITAYGMSFAESMNYRASSAGTVYLQEGGVDEAAGEVLVRNDYALQSGAISNLCVTLYPGVGTNCDAVASLKKTRLMVSDAGRVQLTDSMRLASAAVDDISTIDLSGKTLTVGWLKLNGTKLPTGTYTAAQIAALGYDEIADSSEGETGTVVIGGVGMILVVR